MARTNGSAAPATETPAQPATPDNLYQRLSAPFSYEFQDTRGGVSLTYVTGEQVVSRLNEVLGVTGWSFSVVSHGINSDADEAWVLGELIIYSRATETMLALLPASQLPQSVLVRRQQFGSQKLKRRRSDKSILDIGFDFKGAATDALKKCASQVGVGLYLSRRDGGVPSNFLEKQAYGDSPDLSVCTQLLNSEGEVCGEEIIAKRFADHSEWSAQEIIARSRDINDGKALCFEHLRARLRPAQERTAS